MRKRDLRINDLLGSISKPLLEAMQKVVDSMYLKYDHDKNGYLNTSQLLNMTKDMYK